MPEDGAYTIEFTNYTKGEGNYQNWVLVVNNGTASYNSQGGTEYLVLRADSYGWGTYYNSSNITNNFVNTTADKTADGYWAAFRNAMQGANVVLRVTRLGSQFSVFATITPTDTETYPEFTYTYAPTTVTGLSSESTTFGIELTTDGSHLVISSATFESYVDVKKKVDAEYTYIQSHSGNACVPDTYTSFYNGTLAQASIATAADIMAEEAQTWAQTNRSSYSADTDYSLYIRNAAFETGTITGWTIYGDANTTATSDSDKEGTIEGDGTYYQYYTGWNGRNVSQQISGLPAGLYQLSAKVYSWGTGAPVRLFANGTLSTAEDGTEHTPTLLFSATGEEENIKIGIGGTGNEDNTDNTWGTWGYRVDNFYLESATVTLDAPTFTKTAYSNGSYTVTIDGTQSTYTPASVTIKYTIDDGEEQTYSGAIAVAEGSTVKAYVVADVAGVSNSENAELALTARPSYYATEWEQDFKTVVNSSTYGYGALQTVTGASADFTVNGTNYYNITGFTYNNATVAVSLNTNFGINMTNNVSLRNHPSYQGLLFSNGIGRNIGIQNLAAGDYIVLTVANIVPTALYGATYVEGMSTTSTTSEYYFLATGTEASFNVSTGTYNYLQSVKVLSPTVSKSISAATWATYCSPYALNFSGVDGLTAYIITGDNGTYVTKTQVSDVPANTGVLLYGSEGSYNIPVISSSATNVSSNLLEGVTASTTLAAEGGYVLMNDATNGVAFYMNANAFTLGANTAYLPANVVSNARAFYNLFEDGETGINSPLLTSPAGEELQDGKYLENGKIVIVKNGVKYNVNGQRK